MSISVETVKDCASNYGVFEVEGSKGDTYTVVMHGESGPSCDCSGFKYRGDCKHCKAVYHGACMYNCQYRKATKDPEYRPVDYSYSEFADGECECGDKLVYVKRGF
jgi:uncharacterized Zn finger protein